MYAYVIVLAGGAGTRLWPASTSARPKQFLALGDGTTFLRRALDRALALEPREGVIVVTGASMADAVAEESRGLPAGIPGRGSVRILPEPTGRNTAPAVAWALAAAEAWGGRPEDTFLLMTSDHLIEPIPAFAADAAKAETLAASGNLVCFGIPPRYPATGYGYIEAAEPLGPGFRAAGFREKPDAPTAERFLAAGRYYWNSGMYAFRSDFLRRELGTHAPEVIRAFDSLIDRPREVERRGVRIVDAWEGLEEAYERAPSISLDFAVSEKCASVALVPASFSWEDVGSWDEMARLFPGGSGNAVAIESEGCYVDSDIPVALCGVSDLIVVVRNGAALVLRKGASQLVRRAADRINS
ncbi:MAG: mannose-1-phosphate guanylyltransferase [Treponema sp.]|nr:mannose-1-phosphate guanylyltransferase [Treponema sp.]